MLFRHLILAVFTLIALVLSVSATAATAEPVNLYIDNNQALSKPLKIYVNAKLKSNTKAKLCVLVTSQMHLIKKTSKQTNKDYCTLSDARFEPYEILPNQSWNDVNLPDRPQRFGTLLLFDLSSIDVPIYKNRLLITPILNWGKANKATTKNMISLRNGIAAVLWTVIILVAFLFAVYLLSRKNEKGFLGVLMTRDGRLSMSLTQMALWTMAVGGVVLGFALMGMRVPHIPDSLVWLMGFATITSAVGHWQGHKLQQKIEIDPRQFQHRPIGIVLADLLIIPNNQTGAGDLSLAKVQMLFWTVITLGLFIVKSVGEGELWSVPNELVLLMGISQGAFLTRKQMAYSEANLDQVKG